MKDNVLCISLIIIDYACLNLIIRFLYQTCVNYHQPITSMYVCLYNIYMNRNLSNYCHFCSGEDVAKIESLMDSLTTEDEDGLSSWESWLIRKTKLQRVKQKEFLQKKQQDKQQKETEANTKVLNSIKAEEKRKIWLEKKNYEAKLRKKTEKKRMKAEEELKTIEKHRVEDKSERKFREWLERKDSEAKNQKKNERIKKKEEEELRIEKEERAKEKFENWCKLAQKRPKSVPNSFGYTSGKLTGE